MKPKKLLIGLAVAMAASVGLYLLMNARCYQLIGKLVCHGANDHKRIALTFDDAPSERTSDAVLAVLAEKNVKATFFMIGENMARHPRRRRSASPLPDTNWATTPTATGASCCVRRPSSRAKSKTPTP